jgi:hypothetical protein
MDNILAAEKYILKIDWFYFVYLRFFSYLCIVKQTIGD